MHKEGAAIKKGKLIGKISGIALALVIVVELAGLATPLSPVLADDPVVTFPDAKLDAAIREYIRKPTGDIHQSDLESLTNFDASNKGISDLTGLEYCINMTMLYLEDNRISDISPLSSLTNLTGLDLDSNRISDVSPLSSLTNLTWLDLYGNRISDISPLVDNIGLNEGDEVCLESNYLDLTTDSQAMNDIQTLQDRGVNVFYADVGMPPIAAPIMGLLITPIFVIYLLASLFHLKLHILIIVIIAAAVIVGLVIFFFVRTKRGSA